MILAVVFVLVFVVVFVLVLMEVLTVITADCFDLLSSLTKITGFYSQSIPREISPLCGSIMPSAPTKYVLTIIAA
jgi:hypothetical protein